MRTVYADLAVAYGPSAAALLRLIAANGSPLVLFCTAGKDRTGVMVALLLAAAGVPASSIDADYLRSNERFGLHHLALACEHARRSGGAALAADAILVRPDYLAAARGAILCAHGSVAAYFDDHGADADLRARVRARMTEPV